MTDDQPRGVDYLNSIADLIRSRVDACGEQIAKAGGLVGRCIADGGIIHMFGTGHSRLVAIDAAGRAATVAASHSVSSEEWPGRVERVEGLGEVMLGPSDVRSGDVVVVVSNSGINPLPIDVAVDAKAKGATVIGLGSVAHSQANPSRHSKGRRLLDVCDLFLDTGVPAGDALFTPKDTDAVGAASTVLAASLIHAVVVESVRWMSDNSYDPPVWRSRNLPGGDEHNTALRARYLDRIPELRWS
ncbi:MAG: sugar isomerase domain-containing protein [Nocardioides sp.]|nr:sugar isomerase domain-containing protein [Nocardioides sp.]